MKSNAAQNRKSNGSDFADRISEFMVPGGVTVEGVRAAWDSLEPALPDLLDGFYNAILETPELKAKLGARAMDTAPLKKGQMRHWEYIFTHEPDLEFEGQAARIGEAHVRIGLSGPWLMAAFGRLIIDAIPHVLARHRFSPQKASRVMQSFVSRFFLDMILAQRAFDDGMRRIHHEEDAAKKNLSSLRNVADTICELNELSMAMAILSRNSREATQSGQAISAAAEQMVNSIDEISGNSETAAQEADATNSAAREGLDRMEAVSSAITEIASTAEQTSTSLQELHEASEQIGDFLAVIEQIANQTNLLALNATIEAARAGEAGKGFAVVASEVKSLATQTAKATEDISRRIEALQAGMTMIQGSIASSHEAVGKGQTAMDAAGMLMRSIGGQVSTVSDRISAITSILQQQKDASQEIAQSIGRVAEIAQENDDRLDAMNKTLHTSNEGFSANAKEWFYPDSHRSLCQMAKIDHVLFKKRVVDTVTGRSTWSSGEVPDHHSCRLGKWYDAIRSETLRNHPTFRAMEEPHKRVHACARMALAAHEAGNMAEAYRLLGELETASQEVIESLNAFSEALEGDLAEADKRSSARTTSSGAAELKTKDQVRTLEVRDVSRNGMGLNGLSKEDIGQTVSVQYQGKSRLGETVWSDGERGGVRFLSDNATD